jgi:hypothetical protein
VKLSSTSTFEEFLEENDLKVAALIAANSTNGETIETILAEHRRSAYLFAASAFTDDLNNCLIKTGVFTAFDQTTEKLAKYLSRNQVRYNFFPEMKTIQIIAPSGLFHERFLRSELLLKLFFKQEDSSSFREIILGFIETAQINEVLQLSAHLILGQIKA